MKRWTITIAVMLALGLALLLFPRERSSAVQPATAHSEPSDRTSALCRNASSSATP